MEEGASGGVADDGVKEKEVAKQGEDVTVEVVEAEKVEIGVSQVAEGVKEIGIEESAAGTVASVVPTDLPVPVSEETVQASEAAAETLDTSLRIDSLPHETEVQQEPVLEETPVSEVPREVAEPAIQETERYVPTPAPLVEHRASWLNCCGLFDFLTGSKDNIRT